jgi:alanine racemase
MTPSAHVSVRVDLSAVRANCIRIAAEQGVPVIAVVKADAYGLGAIPVARALADLVDGFYVFELAEAVAYDLAATGRRTIVMRADSRNPADYLAHRVQPAVWDAATATALRSAHPILSVDTGQQRFGVPAGDAAALGRVIKAGGITEAFAHATTPAHVAALIAACRGRVAKLHAAATALLPEHAAALDAVRPGLALYRGAARVTARLVEVRDSAGPAGYTGFRSARHGVFLAGYSHGMRPGGPCLVNGRPSRVPEVGMQSAFVECGPSGKPGDEVVLLGDGLSEAEVGAAWQVTPHEALVRLGGMGRRTYIE